MSQIAINDEYKNWHTNIYSLLFQAYLDKYLLDSIEKFKTDLSETRASHTNNAIFIIAHICNLTKMDLALIIWKIYYDNGNDAKTIKNLNSYLYKNHGIKYKIIETESIKKIRCPIKSARHGFIAHNLMRDEGRDLKIQDLLDVLEDIRIIFNALTLKSIDERVNFFTDEKTFILSFCEKTGFDPMLQNIIHRNKPMEGGDSNA